MKQFFTVVPADAGWINVDLDDTEMDFLWKSIENRGKDMKPELAQKQTEFNPVHDHKGVYSFVIWMKIPTEYNEQKENPIAKNTNSSGISNFCFNYTNIIGENEFYYYEMSKKMEGKMVFFPSKLTHIVYPFYNCCDHRISISGNICLDTTRIYE